MPALHEYVFLKEIFDVTGIPYKHRSRFAYLTFTLNIKLYPHNGMEYDSA